MGQQLERLPHQDLGQGGGSRWHGLNGRAGWFGVVCLPERRRFAYRDTPCCSASTPQLATNASTCCQPNFGVAHRCSVLRRTPLPTRCRSFSSSATA
jgi:hypothetical protein